ncbi:rolling circle replication-associated protein [Weissella cibaria]|uniref:rolling circle replication-associated protein n=1 Tax=Weissella cibaria TaxID=137591 RepID=UPI00106E72D6|nr:hypothetical protein [Weissella cibaria]
MSKELIKPNHPNTKAIVAGNTLEFRAYDHRNTQANIKKISKTEYVNISTGEIKQFENKAVKRTDNLASLRSTFEKMRWIINSNFTGGKSELWITLTYAANMTDEKQLSHDMDVFLKRLKRYVKREIAFIYIPEPQGRGAWHVHMLVKAVDKKKFYIDPNDLSEIWGHGFVKLRRPTMADNLGAYLTAYLGDMPLSEVESLGMAYKQDMVQVKGAKGHQKKFVKGARLSLYPAGMKYFRTSHNLRKPTIIKFAVKFAVMQQFGFDGLVPRHTDDYTFEYKDREGETVTSHVITEQYNRADKKRLVRAS